MCNGKRNMQPVSAPVNEINGGGGKGGNNKMHTTAVLDEQEGFYVALFNTFPDVFFASRSVAMHLLTNIVSLKKDLELHDAKPKEQAAYVNPLKVGNGERKLTREEIRKNIVSDIEQSTRAMELMLLASVDLGELVTLPLEDLFCTSRTIGLGDYRYIDCAEKCVTECLKTQCCIILACTSVYAFSVDGIDFDTVNNPSWKKVYAQRKDGSIFPPEWANNFLSRIIPLFKSNCKVCITCKDNLPMQSSFLQTTNVIALYILQEDAHLLFRQKVSAKELSTLKPIEKVMTDLFGATAPPPSTTNTVVANEADRGMEQGLSVVK